MKRIALLAIALSILSGCAARTGPIRETLVTSEGGAKTYLLTKDVASLLGEAHTVKDLNFVKLVDSAEFESLIEGIGRLW